MPYSSGRQVPLCRLAEFSLWILVALLLAAGTIVGMTEGTHWFPAVIALIGHGLALSALAATVSISNRILRQEAQMRDVFLMGQESATVRQIGRSSV